MKIFEVEPSPLVNSISIWLPNEDLEIDPRPIRYDHWGWAFNLEKNGSILTVKRTDEEIGWDKPLSFRAYSRAAGKVPCFDSTTYTYKGILGERAPANTKVGIVDPTVKVIRMWAFSSCREMTSCVMGDGVEGIEPEAFEACEALEEIRLSRKLIYISSFAFVDCRSIKAFFLPSTLQKIEDSAFRGCTSLEILPLPEDIDMTQIGDNIVEDCDALLDRRLLFYEYDWDEYMISSISETTNNDEVNQSLVEHHCTLPPLYKACLDPSVSGQMIHERVDKNHPDKLYTKDSNGMTPLHIICLNPNVHETPGVIIECFHAIPGAAFDQDNEGMTAMDYLMKYGKIESYNFLLQALCLYRENHASPML